MVPLALSMTGVAVEVFVQIQFAGFAGSTVFSIVRCQTMAPVPASMRRQCVRRGERVDERPRSLTGADTLCNQRTGQHRGAGLDLNRHLLVDPRLPFQRELTNRLLRQRRLRAVPAGALDVAAPREPLVRRPLAARAQAASTAARMPATASVRAAVRIRSSRGTQARCRHRCRRSSRCSPSTPTCRAGRDCPPATESNPALRR